MSLIVNCLSDSTDTIWCLGGKDTLHGGPGADTIDGGETDIIHDDDGDLSGGQ